MSEAPAALVCSDCGRRFRWRPDYRSKPCTGCGGRVRAEPRDEDHAGSFDEPELREQRQGATSEAVAPGGRQWVGDATLAGRPLSRVLDAACYVIAGIALLAASSADEAPAWLPLVGIGGLAYGIRIYATDGSYWTNTLVYVIAVLAVLFSFGLLSGS